VPARLIINPTLHGCPLASSNEYRDRRCTPRSRPLALKTTGRWLTRKTLRRSGEKLTTFLQTGFALITTADSQAGKFDPASETADERK
jgi:hypothetical protein